ncbi:WxL domain-containing protein [Carnobacterium divergens]|uniref:WxL domain-containing protein n=1 Tax=Carnobacterium divergens TaxID=2748 RepID=UPI002890EB12|nr:WxL domain-containing protein [Carnobacterium divergens]MDT2012847.1 WxL domain-containing protein [Carnobacterium divergens]
MKLTKISLMGLVVSSSFVLATPAFADSTLKPNEAATDHSQADIFFKQKSVDPENPNNSGPLMIKRISAIDFGEQLISGNDTTYYANYRDLDKEYDVDGNVIGENMPAYVQVEDNRGTNKGWQLFIKNDGFKTNDAAQTELKAADLTFNVTSVKGATISNNQPSTLPDQFLKENGVTLTNEYQSLVTATDGKGMGTVDLLMGEKNTNGTVTNNAISLFVPGSSTKAKDAKYTTTITWLLMNDPVTAPTK